MNEFGRTSNGKTIKSLLYPCDTKELRKYDSAKEILQLSKESTMSMEEKCLLWLDSLIPIFTSSNEEDLRCLPNAKEWIEIFAYLNEIFSDWVSGLVESLPEFKGNL